MEAPSRSPNSPPSVTVVIVNWNGREFLEECLGSLRALTYPADAVKILLVDNGSSDDSLTFVAENFPEVDVHVNDANNYARANNIGIKEADTPYVALLNNDTVVDPKWLTALVTCLEERPDAAAAGSKILFLDGRINSTGIDSLPDYHWKDRGFGEDDTGQYDRREEVDGLSGCSMLLRRRDVLDIGLLDEDFEMYYEDVDLSFRLRGAGKVLLYEPKSIVHHKYNASIAKLDTERGERREKDRFGERNRVFVVARHAPQDLHEVVIRSRYFLECSSRELRAFLSTLEAKYRDGEATDREVQSLRAVLREAKLQMWRRERHVRSLERELARLRESTVTLRDRMGEEIEYHQKLVADNGARLEKELDAVRHEADQAQEVYRAQVQEAEQARDKAREDWSIARKEWLDAREDWAKEKHVVQEAYRERDEAREAFSAEQARRKDREHWVHLLLNEISMRRIRRLDDSELSFVEFMEVERGQESSTEENEENASSDPDKEGPSTSLQTKPESKPMDAKDSVRDVGLSTTTVSDIVPIIEIDMEAPQNPSLKGIETETSLEETLEPGAPGRPS